MSWLRTPLLHFLVLGALLFAGERWLRSAPAPEERVIEVSSAELGRLRRELALVLGREPSAEELDAQLRAFVDEELLFLEARALGWHRTDPVVQMRLVRNLRFLSDAGDQDAESLLEQAYALGLDRTDIVVRRRLVERMRLAIAAVATRAPPSDEVLTEILDREAERLRRPPLAQLTQVFLSRDRRGEALEDDARRLVDELVAGAVSPEDAIARGDPFLLPAQLPLSSERALAARLGPEFAAAAIELPEGRWSGPIPSAYGLHAVWVHRRVPGHQPGLEEARRELVALWRAEREQEALRAALDRLRERTRIEVARTGPPPGET